MPKVGKGKSAKHFPYTAKGKKAAKSYASKTGQKMMMSGAAMARMKSGMK